MKVRYQNLVTAIFCLLAVQLMQAAEPSYKGQMLSSYLLDLIGQSHDEIRNQDIEAIRRIGTNGIPTLIDLLSVKEKNIKKILSKLDDKNLNYYYNFFNDKEDGLGGVRGLGVDGFAILGTNAESAVPQIAKIFDDCDNETIFSAGRALSKVGPIGFSILTNAINSTNAGVRDVVIRAVGTDGGGDPEEIRHLLVNALKDPNMLIRLHAAAFLRGKDPDSVIPVLIPLLSVGDYGQCSSAAATLAAYGPAARSAAPKLLSVFTNVALGTNKFLIKNLSGLLLNSVRAIDPDTAGEAEDFIIKGGPLGVVGNGWTDTLLPNGKELIAGGFFQITVSTKTNHVFSRAQLFDPVTGKRTETGSMNVARYGHNATLQRDGKVLVTGGYNLNSVGRQSALSSAELYDPVTGKWIVVTNK